jgi:hypothetical protein
MIANPATMMIGEAQSIGDALGESVGNFEMALERKAATLSNYLSAKQLYEDQEAEFIFSLSLEDTDYTSAKNAEARGAVKDVKLVRSRQSGTLKQSWKVYVEAQNERDTAQMAYDQCEARFKAVRVRAELQSSMLRSISN